MPLIRRRDVDRMTQRAVRPAIAFEPDGDRNHVESADCVDRFVR